MREAYWLPSLFHVVHCKACCAYKPRARPKWILRCRPRRRERGRDGSSPCVSAARSPTPARRKSAWPAQRSVQRNGVAGQHLLGSVPVKRVLQRESQKHRRFGVGQVGRHGKMGRCRSAGLSRALASVFGSYHALAGEFKFLDPKPEAPRP